MKVRPLSVMSVAVNHNRIGFCFLIDRQPCDWELSFKGAKSPDEARKVILRWLEFYAPDIVITEDISAPCRKGHHSRKIIAAIKEMVSRSSAHHIEVERVQLWPNKYDEIEHLCSRFPQMTNSAPKRRKFWDKEPPRTTIFEALALALLYLDQSAVRKTQPPTDLPV